MWLFDEEEVYEGMYCIVRGLKVVEETYWDTWTQRRQPSGNGARALDCKDRTAVENVTDVEEIKACFDS